MSERAEIIDLTEAHLPEMVVLRQQTEQLHQDLLPRLFQGPREPKDTATHLRRYLTDDPKAQRRAIGYVEDGRLCGYALYSTFVWEADDTMKERRGIYVRDIAVDPACRRKSIAQQLLQVLADEAAADGQPAELHATIWAGNTASEALFRQAGFTPLNTSYALYLDPPEAGDGP
ncbi:MAG: GNAT family N-acetyltransferase [Pseudomonadota bacterium]